MIHSEFSQNYAYFFTKNEIHSFIIRNFPLKTVKIPFFDVNLRLIAAIRFLEFVKKTTSYHPNRQSK